MSASKSKTASKVSKRSKKAGAAAPVAAAAAAAAAAASDAGVLRKFAGYSVLPVTVTAPEAGVPAYPHTLFIRKHTSQTHGQVDSPEGSVLFVTNIPPVCSRAALAALFTDSASSVIGVTFGVLTEAVRDSEEVLGHHSVAHADFHVFPPRVCLASHALKVDLTPDEKAPGPDSLVALRHPRGTCAYVAFASAADVDRVLAWSAATPRELHLLGDISAVNRYKQTYAAFRPAEAALSARVDKLLMSLDSIMEARAQAERILASQPDDDGFVLVTSGSGNAAKKSSRPMVSTYSHQAELVADKGPKPKKELVNFYRFQQRQAKRDQLADLRRKFEEDKQKIERMKASRQFRPF